MLVAEDNPINQKLIVKMLQRLGLDGIAVADDGQRALDVVLSGGIDLVLMDMQMPNMSGVEATLALRAQDLPVQPDIVALTANAFDEDRQTCLGAGMDDFLTKPIRLELLAGVLAQAARGDYATRVPSASGRLIRRSGCALSSRSKRAGIAANLAAGDRHRSAPW